MIKSSIQINPPPINSRCECCGNKEILTKIFRPSHLGDDQVCLGPSWECVDCIGLTHDQFFQILNKFQPQR